MASASAPMTIGPRMWPPSVIVRNQPTATPCSGGAIRSPMSPVGRLATKPAAAPIARLQSPSNMGVRHERKAPQESRIGEQAWEQHPHSAPAV